MTKAENAYRTIAEVAELLELPASVLRFWETQFRQVRPLKRMGRRYYSADDIALLIRIKNDLYCEKYTIKGVQKRLKDNPDGVVESAPVSVSPAVQEAFVREITDIRDFVARYLE